MAWSIPYPILRCFLNFVEVFRDVISASSLTFCSTAAMNRSCFDEDRILVVNLVLPSSWLSYIDVADFRIGSKLVF